VAGVLLKPYIVGPWRSLYVVAAALIVVGVLMWLADRLGKQGRALPGLTLVDALVVGAAQACALIPGVSRSGATLTAALFIGLRRDDAARFSFLLSIPAVAAAGIFELRDAAPTREALPGLALATAVAAISGYASIAWLLRWLRTRTLTPFSIYRVVLGLLLVGLLYGKYLMPQ
jgi:undecaprenyl-diphosphatase